MSILKVNTIQDKGGNTLLSSDGAGAISSGGAITNTPMFFGKKVSDQTLTRATTTKITGFTTGEIDTDSAFDGTTFTVPSGKGGKYYISSTVWNNFSGIGSDGFICQNHIYVNGSNVLEMKFENTNNQIKYYPAFAYTYLDLSAGDYVEIYAYQADSNGGNGVVLSTYTQFGGYRLIGA